MDAKQSLSGEAQAHHESNMALNRRMGRNSFIRFIFIVILLLTLCTSAMSKTLGDELVRRKLIDRVVGGTGVSDGTYTYFVHIDIDGYPWCGGSLVAPDVVLTAAHCQPLVNENMTVIINGYHRNITVNTDQEYREVMDTWVHPGYNDFTLYNDIMLLKLLDPVTSVPWVKLNQDSDKPEQNETLTVMGLGKIVEGGPYPDVLQAAEVQVMNHTECRRSYNLLGIDIKEDTMFCTGSPIGATDSCQGDSGGPIINQGGQQVGVVVWYWLCPSTLPWGISSNHGSLCR